MGGSPIIIEQEMESAIEDEDTRNAPIFSKASIWIGNPIIIPTIMRVANFSFLPNHELRYSLGIIARCNQILNLNQVMMTIF